MSFYAVAQPWLGGGAKQTRLIDDDRYSERHTALFDDALPSPLTSPLLITTNNYLVAMTSRNVMSI